MTERAEPKKNRVTIGDLHSAIELLAIEQAQIGLAVMAILSRDQEATEENRQLFGWVKDSVEKLQSLAEDLIDVPYGN